VPNERAPRPDARPGERELPYPVGHFVRLVSTFLEERIGVVWIEGEVSSLRLPSSGHVYFVLKDRTGQIPAILWRSAAQKLAMPLAEGQLFVCRGKLGLFPEQGKVQLYVDWAEPSGLGAAAARLELLKKRLAAEGLFDAARKRPLPRYPRRVAVVTSPTGAAVRDIVRAIWRRYPTPILVSPCKVQGEGAAADVAHALRRVGRMPLVDVVIVGRGGGSSEDLSAFNEEPVVRAIVGCPVPVVSAVGHEIDVTLADLAADARAATPTAAGELVVPERQLLEQDLIAAERRLLREARHQLAARRAVLERLAGRLVHPGRQLALKRQALGALERRLQAHDPAERLRAGRLALGAALERAAAAARRIVAARGGALGALAARLDAMSPLKVLERGYAIVRTPDGAVVTSAAGVVAGDALEVRLSEGVLDVQVREVKPG
jgi:exodeoxyribonuclease VII large subunit